MRMFTLSSVSNTDNDFSFKQYNNKLDFRLTQCVFLTAESDDIIILRDDKRRYLN